MSVVEGWDYGNNKQHAIAIDANGNVLTVPQAVAAGEATAANQASQITQETATAGALGTTADGAQPDPTQTASLIALVKGWMQLIGGLADTVVAAGATGSISAKLRAISRDLIANIVLATGSNVIGRVGGTSIEVSDEFARPADVLAYAVGDAVGAATTDSGTTPLRSIVVGAANGASGYLTKLRLMTDQSACVAVIRVHFYTVAAPPTVIPGDNVAMGLAWANRAKRIGAIDLPALATELGTVTAARTQDLATRLAFQCDPADNKIYYRLETQTVFTPANAQNFFLALTSERNGG